MQVIKPLETISGPLGVATRPLTHCRAKFVQLLASSSTLCSSAYAATGSITLSSKLPLWPHTVMTVWLPITWAHTIVTLSAITGLTLPGMMEEPAVTAARHASAEEHAMRTHCGSAECAYPAALPGA